MSNLVEQLRDRAATRNTGILVVPEDRSTMGYYSASSASLDREAAACIEALEAALRRIAELCEHYAEQHVLMPLVMHEVIDRARAALGKDTGE